ncbi:helix-turn-helix domain-containing protein [Mesorhizobium caraganae]|uniref:helix-turn-helix domain-containing protein n=1 Tax=Mesorhizobium caraganae TaxID=483206 RepID=UPI00178320CA|nr:helix-turn-helix domain-containing protein [Mesorhizobium caraganae]MBM2712805.1 helix-turn-helix domain-containing protein [Mesorhizobium caraganae]
MVVITTQGVPAGERFDFWRDRIAHTALEFRMEPVEHAPYGEIRLAAIGGIGLMKYDGAVATSYSRTRAEISRSQGPYFFVQLQLRGNCQLERAEQQSTLLVGEGFVGDPLREFKMAFDTSLDAGKCSLVVRLPREALSARVARPDLVHCSLLQRHRPLARLLTSYLLNGLDVADEISPEAAVLFEDHATELLAQALKEAWAEQPTPSEAWREAIFVRACRLIKLRCSNPHLAPVPLARELGISSRLLQRIFAERAETVMKRVFSERIARAAKLLGAPDAAHRSVTEIAFSCGFNDSSHFGRVFVAQTSMTPTEWRRRGLEIAAR